MVVPFNAGCDPTIVIVNHASMIPTGFDLAKMVAALQKLVDQFAAVYGFGAKLFLADGSLKDGPAWAVILVDHTADADALGYHERSDAGLPQAIIAVDDTLGAGDQLEDCISHEVLEMLADPGTNIAISTNAAQTEFVAGEVCDPVQGEVIEIDGFRFASFVYPAWFQSWSKTGPFDATGACTKPLQVLPAGYVSKFRRGAWTERFGGREAKKKFAKRHHARAARRRGR